MDAIDEAKRLYEKLKGNPVIQQVANVVKQAPISYAVNKIKPSFSYMGFGSSTPQAPNANKTTFANLGQPVTVPKLNAVDQANRILQTITAPVKATGNFLKSVNLPEIKIPNTPLVPTSFMGNLPGRNTISNAIKGAFPITQLPEQVNYTAQSYGRSLTEPTKYPIETALNLLPFVGFAKTKPIQQALRERVAIAKTPQEAAVIYNEFADKVMKSGAKSDLQALRATLNKELTALVGGTGEYKKDYAIIQTMKNDTQVGGIVRTLLDKVSSIDEMLGKQKTAVEKIVNPEMRAMAEQAASKYLNPLRGLGKDVARKGYTATEVMKMKPREAVNILAGEELADIVKNTPVSKKVNIIDYLRTPEKVLQKIGLGGEAKNLRTNYEAYQTQLPKEITKIQEWMKRVPSQEGNERIFRFLDGERGVTLTPEEGKVAQEIRGYLNTWADKLKLPQHKRVTDYITRLYKLGTVEQEFDEDLAKLINYPVTKSVYDPFLEKRIGSRIDYVKDTWQALSAYAKRATRKVNLDPALEQLANKAPELELSQWNYVKKLTDRINMRPTEIDTLIDNAIKSTPIGYKIGQRPTALLTRNVRTAVYRGTLGLNVSSALRNLTQGTNTFAELGTKWTFNGYTKLFKNWNSKELQEVGVLRDSFIQDKSLSVYRKAVQGFDKGLMALFEGAEKINRGACYYGAKAKALSQGMDESRAIEYAKELVRKTQFTFGSIDTPVALSSDLSKSLMQLQTYNLKQIEYLLGKVANKELGGLVRWVGSMLVLQKVMKDQLGMKLDLLPMNFSLTPSLQIGQSVGQLAFGDEQTKEEAKRNLLKSWRTVVPAGVQIGKTFEAIKAMREGGSYTPSGTKRFDVKPSLKTGVMGIWSTPESQQYLKERAGEPSYEEQAMTLYLQGDKQGALKVMKQNNIKLDANKVEKYKNQQMRDAAKAYVNDDKNGALKIMKQYGFQLSESDVQHAAKLKAAAYYRNGRKDKALEVMKKYKVTLGPSDIE